MKIKTLGGLLVIAGVVHAYLYLFGIVYFPMEDPKALVYTITTFAFLLFGTALTALE